MTAAEAITLAIAATITCLAAWTALLLAYIHHTPPDTTPDPDEWDW